MHSNIVGMMKSLERSDKNICSLRQTMARCTVISAYQANLKSETQKASFIEIKGSIWSRACTLPPPHRQAVMGREGPPGLPAGFPEPGLGGWQGAVWVKERGGMR